MSGCDKAIALHLLGFSGRDSRRFLCSGWDCRVRLPNGHTHRTERP